MDRLDLKLGKLKTGATLFSGEILAFILAIALIESDEQQEITLTTLMTIETACPIHWKIIEWDKSTEQFEASDRFEVLARVSRLMKNVNFVDGQVEKKVILYLHFTIAHIKSHWTRNADLEQPKFL